MSLSSQTQLYSRRVHLAGTSSSLGSKTRTFHPPCSCWRSNQTHTNRVLCLFLLLSLTMILKMDCLIDHITYSWKLIGDSPHSFNDNNFSKNQFNIEGGTRPPWLILSNRSHYFQPARWIGSSPLPGGWTHSCKNQFNIEGGTWPPFLILSNWSRNLFLKIDYQSFFLCRSFHFRIVALSIDWMNSVSNYIPRKPSNHEEYLTIACTIAGTYNMTWCTYWVILAVQYVTSKITLLLSHYFGLFSAILAWSCHPRMSWSWLWPTFVE